MTMLVIFLKAGTKRNAEMFVISYEASEGVHSRENFTNGVNTCICRGSTFYFSFSKKFPFENSL